MKDRLSNRLVNSTMDISRVSGIDPQGDISQFNVAISTIAPYAICMMIATSAAFIGSGMMISGNQIDDNHIVGFRGDYADREQNLKLKNYSKEKFKDMGNEPLVKEILAGVAKIPKKDIKQRIDAHLQ